MFEQININNRKILYKLKRSSARCIRLSVLLESLLIVYVPNGVGKKDIKMALLKKEKWLNKHLNNTYSLNSDLFNDSKGHFLEYKAKAENQISKRVEKINSFLGYKYNNLHVKNQKTILGSCSSKKNLNFNYKIIFLPKKKMDEIIIHELSHLKVMNHSKTFYNLLLKNMEIVDSK